MDIEGQKLRDPLNFVPAIAAAIQQQLEAYPDSSENLLKEQQDQVGFSSKL